MSPGRLRSALLCALVLATSAAWAQSVSNPFAGVTLVRTGSQALAIADLCAAGVHVRATKYSERDRTPASWAGVVGAQVAINGDFFDFPGWTWVIGRAMGAGEPWPAADQLREYREYWQFGPNIAAFAPDAHADPMAGVTEMVGSHNTIISNGQSLGPNFDGDAVITGAYRRTAIGISQDGTFLYLYSSDTAQTGSDMVATMASLAASAGAPPIWFATNQDGGGSSQMFVQGLGQIIDSGRPVNNHLGVIASGSGAPGSCRNHPPVGYLDVADCTHLAGWSEDVDTPNTPNAVHLYLNAPAGAAGAVAFAVSAGNHRADLCSAIGSCDHGFDTPTPPALLDGKAHTVYLYGIDTAGGRNASLGQHTLTCSPSVPAGVRRHIASPTVLANWGLNLSIDELQLTDATFNKISAGVDLPAAPVLVQVAGNPAVYLSDQGYARHVVSQASAARWHLDLSKTQTVSAEELAKLKKAPDLPEVPFLVRSASGAVDVIDSPFPVVVKPTPDAGTSTPSQPTTPTGGEPPTEVDGGTAPVTSSAQSGAVQGCGSVAGGEMAALGVLALFTWTRARRRRTSA